MSSEGASWNRWKKNRGKTLKLEVMSLSKKVDFPACSFFIIVQRCKNYKVTTVVG